MSSAANSSEAVEAVRQQSTIQTVESFLNQLEGSEAPALPNVHASESQATLQRVAGSPSSGSEWYRPGSLDRADRLDSRLDRADSMCSVDSGRYVMGKRSTSEPPPRGRGTISEELPYTLLFDFLDECYRDPINPILESQMEDLKNAVEVLSRNEGEAVRIMDTTLSQSTVNHTIAADFLKGNLGIKVKTMKSKEKDESIKREDTKWRNSSTQLVPDLDAAKFASLLQIDSFCPHAFVTGCREQHKGYELSVLAHMFQCPYDLVGRYSIQTKILIHWLEEIRGQYNADNPYHNWAHAVGVAQFCYYCVVSEGGNFFNFQDILAIYVAALAHDVAHPGVNAQFLINRQHEFALRYNDKAPLENMHACVASQALRKYDFLAEAEPFKHDTFRVKLIAAILATDMSTHFNFEDRFKTRVARMEHEPLMKDTKMLKERQEASKSDRRMLLEAFVKMGDQCMNVMPYKIHLLQVRALEAENFAQGDEERKLGIAISPMYDREKDTFAGTQDWFLKNLVRPILIPFRSLISKSHGDKLLRRLDINRARWREALQQHGDDKSVEKLFPLLMLEEERRQTVRTEKTEESRRANAARPSFACTARPSEAVERKIT